eukprot:NODE_296_length_11478_cov_0.345197.p5 type:complete len:281 gc:universal NODE_296_length_11478_cov_0.345197:3526-4368(+)
MEELKAKVAYSLLLLNVPHDKLEVYSMSLQTRCAILTKLLQMLGISISFTKKSIKSQFISISTHLSGLNIEFKRTWFMDIRPSQHVFTLILRLSQIVMSRHLESAHSNDNKVSTDTKLLVESCESIITETQSHLSALFSEITKLELAAHKLQDANRTSTLSLTQINQAMEKLNYVFQSPFSEFTNFNPHSKYQFEYPQTSSVHPLLKFVIKDGKCNSSAMVKILADTISSSSFSITPKNIPDFDLNSLEKQLRALESEFSLDFMDEVAFVDLGYFEQLEI